MQVQLLLIWHEKINKFIKKYVHYVCEREIIVLKNYRMFSYNRKPFKSFVKSSTLLLSEFIPLNGYLSG